MPEPTQGLYFTDPEGGRHYVVESDFAAAKETGLTLEPGQTASYQDNRGNLTTVKGEDFIDTTLKFHNPNAVLAGPGEVRGAVDDAIGEERYSGVGNAIGAGALGVARTATGSLSDLALTESGAMDPEQLRGLRKYQAGPSIIGELAGAVGPGMLAGGAGLAGSIARKTVSGQVAKQGAKLSAKLGGGIKGAMVSEGIEGAIFNAGQGASNLILSDEPLAAEAAYGEIGMDAIIGGGLGIVGGAAAGTLGKLGNKVKNAQLGKGNPKLDFDTPEGKLLADGLDRSAKELDDVSGSIFNNADLAASPKASEVIDGSVAKQYNSAVSKHLDDLEDRLDNVAAGAFGGDASEVSSSAIRRGIADDVFGSPGSVGSDSLEGQLDNAAARSFGDDVPGMSPSGIRGGIADDVFGGPQQVGRNGTKVLPGRSPGAGDPRGVAGKLDGPAETGSTVSHKRPQGDVPDTELNHIEKGALNRINKDPLAQPDKATKEYLESVIKDAEKKTLAQAEELEVLEASGYADDIKKAAKLRGERNARDARIAAYQGRIDDLFGGAKKAELGTVAGKGKAKAADTGGTVAGGGGKRKPIDVGPEDVGRNGRELPDIHKIIRSARQSQGDIVEFLGKKGLLTDAGAVKWDNVSKLAGKDLQDSKKLFSKLQDDLASLPGSSSLDDIVAAPSVVKAIPAGAVDGVADAAKVARSAQSNLRAKLGLGEDDSINLRKLFDQSPEEALESVKAFEEYSNSMKSLADLTDGTGNAAAARIQKSMDEISEIVTEAIGKEGKVPDLASMAVLFGLEEALLPELPGPADDLLKMVFAYKMVKGMGQARAGAGILGKKGVKGFLKEGVQGIVGRGMTKDIFSPLGRLQNALGRQVSGKAFDFVMGGTGRLSAATDKAVARVQDGMARSLTTAARAARRSSPVTATVLREASFSGEGDLDRKKEKNAHAAFKARSQELSRNIANLPAFQQTVHDNLASIRQVNLGVGDKLAAHTVATAQFLHSKMPKDPGTLQQFGMSKWRPTEAQMDKWARYINAANDPAGIVERFGNGHMSREDAETLRTLYPSHFAKVQEWVMDNITEMQDKMPYERRIQISSLMGVPADPTVSRVNIWQDSFAEEEPVNPREPMNIEGANQPTASQQMSGARE